MKIAIKRILSDYEAQTGEKVSQDSLAREMVAKGLFRSFASAKGMMQYTISGKAKSLDTEMIRFFMDRFDLKLEDVITDIYN